MSFSPNYPYGYNNNPYGYSNYPQYAQNNNSMSMINKMSYIPGRTIQNINEVAPNEVSMDGTVSLFPTSDYSAIYAKMWNANGTISTYKFVPEKLEEPVGTSNQVDLSEILTRLDRIESYFSNLTPSVMCNANDKEV